MSDSDSDSYYDTYSDTYSDTDSVISEYFDFENNFDIDIINRFDTDRAKFYENQLKDFEIYKKNPLSSKLKEYKLKYPHIRKKLGKNTKLHTIKFFTISTIEFFKITDRRPSNEMKYSEEEKKIIIKYLIKKIRGIYKHAQAFKTGICNIHIMNGISKNQLTLAITKNTLEANEQWLKRIIRDIKKNYPTEDISKKIMLISSKKNDLNGNATHCKNMADAWKIISGKHDFCVVFCCSNSVRLNDILDIVDKMKCIKEEYLKIINIIHDEAHNKEDGIPAFRNTIENIISKPIVDRYIPCTASNNNIALPESDNPLWTKNHLEKLCFNYTDFNNNISTDEAYSSVQDYNKIFFEDLKKHENWNNEYINCVSRKLFMSVTDEYKNKIFDELSDDKQEDIDNRRYLEFCPFMKNHKEIEALNRGINCLNINNLGHPSYFIKGKLNLHIISTPCRKIITKYLCKEAIKKDYNPIVLGIYGNQGKKFHLSYDNKRKEVSKIMGSGEFNIKIQCLIKWLKKHKITTKRPFIIIGNYKPTGESLSFVNSDYGIVRGNIRLVSTDMEEDYQQSCRGCFMKHEFIKNDPIWTTPDKYLVGEKKYIENALIYERENDARITNDLNNRELDENINTENIDITLSQQNTTYGITAIPIKCEIVDDDDDKIEEIKLLMEPNKKKNHTADGKKGRLMELIQNCIDEDLIQFNDTQGKFKFDTFKLKDFRCWKRQFHNKPNRAQSWKFSNYKMHYNAGTPFINNNNGHNKNECEICCCYDTFKAEKNSEKIINSKNIFWIGYKY